MFRGFSKFSLLLAGMALLVASCAQGPVNPGGSGGKAIAIPMAEGEAVLVDEATKQDLIRSARANGDFRDAESAINNSGKSLDWDQRVFGFELQGTEGDSTHALAVLLDAETEEELDDALVFVYFNKGSSLGYEVKHVGVTQILKRDGDRVVESAIVDFVSGWVTRTAVADPGSEPVTYWGPIFRRGNLEELIDTFYCTGEVCNIFEGGSSGEDISSSGNGIRAAVPRQINLANPISRNGSREPIEPPNPEDFDCIGLPSYLTSNLVSSYNSYLKSHGTWWIAYDEPVSGSFLDATAAKAAVAAWGAVNACFTGAKCWSALGGTVAAFLSVKEDVQKDLGTFGSLYSSQIGTLGGNYQRDLTVFADELIRARLLEAQCEENQRSERRNGFMNRYAKNAGAVFSRKLHQVLTGSVAERFSWPAWEVEIVNGLKGLPSRTLSGE